MDAPGDNRLGGGREARVFGDDDAFNRSQLDRRVSLTRLYISSHPELKAEGTVRVDTMKRLRGGLAALGMQVLWEELAEVPYFEAVATRAAEEAEAAAKALEEKAAEAAAAEKKEADDLARGWSRD